MWTVINFLTSRPKYTVKPVLSGHSKRRRKIGFKTDCHLMQVKEHSAILSTFIKLPFVFKTSVLSIFEWRLKIGFTVSSMFKLISLNFTLNNSVSLKTQSGQHIHYSNAQGKEVYDDDSAQKSR